jgi:hypothetical protein
MINSSVSRRLPPAAPAVRQKALVRQQALLDLNREQAMSDGREEREERERRRELEEKEDREDRLDRDRRDQWERERQES